ncbi:Vancomycin resistance VanW [Syntrophomonas zehnderi OL-4]|uniref:Vancomycin resistance VanW n=1 Tax=Syntrophomonas zehnderi OL-4 TaxID=690567 RepID=A0A0E3W3A7_9FIRM|nr:Vancomycin resistance VanW [Syntrophomonas zehnderi OL-4]
MGVKKGVTIEGVQVERLLPGELREVIEEIAIQVQKLPVEPSIDKQTGAILPEKPGMVINVEDSVNQILAAAEGDTVKLKRVKVQPRYKKESLEQARNCLGNYATGFRGSGERYKNISVACYSINHTIIWPGEEFSFNETTGPRTPERGYLPAPVIIGGSFGMDYGGGVCQVSSTLYNAALNAHLPIVERHAHSKPIHYVPPGKDATVSYGDQDLRFRNNRTGPLIIKASMYRGRISAEIWGGNN